MNQEMFDSMMGGGGVESNMAMMMIKMIASKVDMPSSLRLQAIRNIAESMIASGSGQYKTMVEVINFAQGKPSEVDSMIDGSEMDREQSLRSMLFSATVATAELYSHFSKCVSEVDHAGIYEIGGTYMTASFFMHCMEAIFGLPNPLTEEMKQFEEENFAGENFVTLESVGL